MEDKMLTCIECGKSFAFTEGERLFFVERGFDNEPRRCPECRAARKRSKNNNFSSGGYKTGAMRINKRRDS